MTAVVFVVLAFGTIGLVLVAAVQCLWTRPKYWALWLVFIVFGIGSVSLDLTSGEITADLLHLTLLGAMFAKDVSGQTGDWVVSLSAPIGALLWFARSNAPAVKVRH